MNQPKVKGKKIALVTGASSGLGESISRLLVYEGYEVIGVARREKQLEYLKEVLGPKFSFMKCDVSKKEDIKKVSNELRNLNLKPSLFFLNAGYLKYEEYGKLDIEEYKKNFDVNYFGAINWIEEWLPYALDHGGTFVGISSLASKIGIPFLGSYCATKSALSKTFESMQVAYYKSKARFIIVFPGFIDTPLLQENKNTPFVIKSLDAAKYIIEKVHANKKSIAFPFIYKILIMLSKIAPIGILNRIFKSHKNIFEKK